MAIKSILVPDIRQWDRKTFLSVVIIAYVLLWGLIGLSSLWFGFQLFREIIGLICLLLVPGMVLVRILRIRIQGYAEFLLYVLGSSIAFLMLAGWLANAVFPMLGITRPISTIPVLSALTIFILIMAICSWVMEKNRDHSSKLNSEQYGLISVASLAGLVLLSVVGSVLMSRYGVNHLVVWLLLVIPIFVVWFAFRNTIPEYLYITLIFMVGLAMLFQTSLISNYLTGYDIQEEYYFAHLVLQSGHWNLAIPSDLNAMLSIVMLPPIITTVTSISLVWIYKVIFNIIFASVPVGIYCISKRLFSDPKIAFLTAVFFETILMFYTYMPQLPRQEIAELFLVLIVLLLLNLEIEPVARSVLLILFSFALVVSHYGLSYIYLGIFIVTGVVVQIHQRKVKEIDRSREPVPIGAIIILFIVFAVSWYLYISSAATFNIFTSFSAHMISNVRDTATYQSIEPVNVIVSSFSITRQITKYIFIVDSIFLTVGMIYLYLNYRKIDSNFFALAAANFLMYIASFVLPHFADYSTDRIFQIGLVVLAPLVVQGGIVLMSKIGLRAVAIGVLSVFFAVSLIFNDGLAAYFANDNPTSLSLITQRNEARFNQEEVMGAEWIATMSHGEQNLFGDAFGFLVLLGYSYDQVATFDPGQAIPKGGNLYLRTFNVASRTMYMGGNDYYGIENYVSGLDEIYDNGGSLTYHKE